MKPTLPWAQDLSERIEAETSSLFVLHHNISDYVPLGQAFLPFSTFLAQWLGETSPVILYNRSTGLRFPDEEIQKLLGRSI